MRGGRPGRVRRIGRVMERHAWMALAAPLVVWVLLPLYWPAVMSLVPPQELFAFRLVPTRLSLENYRALAYGEWAGVIGPSFLRAIRNSVVVSVLAATTSVVVATLAGYGLQYTPMRGRSWIEAFVLLAYVFPPFVLVVGLFSLVGSLGLDDTLLGVLVLDLVLTVPYATWMLRGYLSSIPGELVEAALVDGASHIQALFRVVVPVAAPAIASVAIFAFTLSWQDLLFSLVTLRTPERFTVPMALMQMVQGDLASWGKLMAGLVLGSAPPVAVYLVLQRYVVSGLIAGAVKQ